MSDIEHLCQFCFCVDYKISFLWMFGAAQGAQVGLVYWFHGSVSDPAGRRTSSSFYPHPQRRLQSYKGKKLGMGWVWAHSEKQSGLR